MACQDVSNSHRLPLNFHVDKTHSPEEAHDCIACGNSNYTTRGVNTFVSARERPMLHMHQLCALTYLVYRFTLESGGHIESVRTKRGTVYDQRNKPTKPTGFTLPNGIKKIFEGDPISIKIPLLIEKIPSFTRSLTEQTRQTPLTQRQVRVLIKDCYIEGENIQQIESDSHFKGRWDSLALLLCQRNYRGASVFLKNHNEDLSEKGFEYYFNAILFGFYPDNKTKSLLDLMPILFGKFNPSKDAIVNCAKRITQQLAQENGYNVASDLAKVLFQSTPVFLGYVESAINESLQKIPNSVELNPSLSMEYEAQGERLTLFLETIKNRRD